MSIHFTFNEQFFDNPEQWGEEQAYWLGWLVSDGANSGKQIKISLQAIDKEVLECLKNLIQYEGPLHFCPRAPESIFGKEVQQYQHRWALCISRTEFCSKLIKQGICSDKARDLDFPSYLRKDLYPHFIRGLFEGDGTFCFTKWNKMETNLLANEKTLVVIQDIFAELGLSSSIKDLGFKNGVKVLRLCGNQKCARLFNYIYGDCKYFLKRKVTPFIQLYHFRKGKKTKDRSSVKDVETFHSNIQRFIA